MMNNRYFAPTENLNKDINIMNEKIKKALEQQFGNHRIVFWYDEKQEFEELFAELDLAGVEKIRIANNEFQVKYRILRQEAKKKFLLYLPYQQFADTDNWLLDVQLAEGVFKSDNTGLLLSEFGTNGDLKEVLKACPFFLNSEKRRKDLQDMVEGKDSKREIKLKMLAVCTNTSNDVEAILSELIKEYVVKKDNKLKLIIRCNLEATLWQIFADRYNYQTDKPSLKDFIAELFDNSWKYSLDEKIELNNFAVSFLNSFKDNRKNRELFSELANEFADFYKIANSLHKIDAKKIINIDLYKQVDTALVDYLINAILQETISHKECVEIIKYRENSFWYAEYREIYSAISFAQEFKEKLLKTNLNFTSMTDAFQKYTTTWYELDLIYRRFSLKYRKTQHNSALDSLRKRMDNLYTNIFLLDLNNKWQDKFDLHQKTAYTRQRDFYSSVVAPELKQHKLIVIISDALRYEVGQELLSKIKSTNRYAGEIDFMVGNIPSYTALGMASLLPHQTLSFADKNTGNILIDGKTTVGLDNRNKILESAEAEASAYNYTDIINSSADDLKELCVANRLIYIYHNTIDATGDKLNTEDDLPLAVEQAVEELTGLVRKLGGTNRIANIIITADHGFLYQNSKVEDSDFIELASLPETVKSRRYIIGKNLPQVNSTTKFSSEELDLGSGFEILIPKSINKFRVQGSGSKFVHGGASLQELVIPLIKINKNARVDDVEDVEVEIFSSSTKVITTGQLAVTLYQKEAVTEKKQARFVSVGLYSEEDVLLSNCIEININKTSEEPREREHKVQLLLNHKAEKYNNQNILLKVKEKKNDTTKFVDYKSQNYFLKRTIFNDF